jgi:hypothetical protein
MRRAVEYHSFAEIPSQSVGICDKGRPGWGLRATKRICSHRTSRSRRVSPDAGQQGAGSDNAFVILSAVAL